MCALVNNIEIPAGSPRTKERKSLKHLISFLFFVGDRGRLKINKSLSILKKNPCHLRAGGFVLSQRFQNCFGVTIIAFLFVEMSVRCILD